MSEEKYYKFYKYQNNPYGSDYCFCQRPCESNMSLNCFLENGEILGFMSESLVFEKPQITEIDMNEFMFDFVRPLIKENKELHNKIDKTVEYIENNGHGYDITGDGCYCLDEDEQKELLEILKGDVNEN